MELFGKKFRKIASDVTFCYNPALRMSERLTSETGDNLELMTISRDFCHRIINTGREIVREQKIDNDGELADLLTCGSSFFHSNHNVGIIARGGVCASADYIESRKPISIGSFFLAYGKYPQSSEINLDQANDFVLKYVQDLGFINQPDLRSVKPNLKKTDRAKRIQLKHPDKPVLMSLRLSGDLKAEGFQLFFVTG